MGRKCRSNAPLCTDPLGMSLTREMVLPRGPRSCPTPNKCRQCVRVCHESSALRYARTLETLRKVHHGKYRHQPRVLLLNRLVFMSDHSKTRRGGVRRSRHLIRATARVARSLADLLLRFSLVQEFRTTSAPRVDKPVAYLFTVSAPSSHVLGVVLT